MSFPQTGETAQEVKQLLFTADEAAPIVSLTAYWLTTNARAGKIPHRRIGKLYRWAREDLEAIKAMSATPAKRRSKQKAAS
ncbi:helix-turn-helix domain-containing protein [Microtetraspora sp. AC03309]|uniref:helix-turn-helix domain-containing protein n=1 Tax=Microtetraspora sp. AC03309 TaxID=2779376 RepID=UPI001E2FC26D|nr:helix-turn-helix domain-containing protein [Microtetraspora sp. AC03309]MCC5574572.1 helix-turn-helix domain-containing protein [Microtetraspora sp. AC03309]